MTQPEPLSRLLRLALDNPEESALRALTAELIRLGHSGDPTGKQAHVLMQHETMRPHIAFETEADAVAYERAGKLAGSRIEVFCIDLISPAEAAPMIAERRAEARSHRLQQAMKILRHNGLEDEDLAALGIALPAPPPAAPNASTLSRETQDAILSHIESEDV
jgi:hypothetical protein